MARLTFEDAYFEDEDILETVPLSAVARRAVARVELEVEESAAVQSTRPTVAIFLGEPWR